ncbi:hypothetical protein REPUB_Repub07fG0099700 [Reevesia pubescens]
MGLSLNIDVSARSFFEPILVTEFVAKHFKHTNLSRPLSDQDRIKVKKALKGVRVELNHMKHAKTFKIAGISVDDDDGDGRVPPHENLARRASFSAHEGIGRTLKGRDLRRVRNVVRRKNRI